jgi:nucleoside-diphosphate-sugar epimerase
MKILVLGDAGFVVGRFADALRAYAHDVTAWDDGPDFAAASSHWDLAIYCSKQISDSIQKTCKGLRESIDKLIVISSLDGSHRSGGINEQDCADIVDTFGHDATIMRTGVVLAPNDPDTPLLYWFERLKLGGEVLAPGLRSNILPILDIRDLVDVVIELIDDKKVGNIPLISLSNDVPMLSFVEECRAVCGSDATFTWVSDSFLQQEKLTPGSDIPLWFDAELMAGWREQFNSGSVLLPEDDMRSLAGTLSAVYQWHYPQNSEHVRRFGISPEREQDVLDDWHKLSVPYRA